MTELEKERAKQRRRRNRQHRRKTRERVLRPINTQSPPQLSDAVLREQFEALDDAQRASFEKRAADDFKRSKRVRTETKTNLESYY